MKTQTFLKAGTLTYFVLLFNLSLAASGPPNIPGFNPDVIRPFTSFYANVQMGPSGFFNPNVNDLDGLTINHNLSPHIEFGYKRMFSLYRNDPVISNQWRRFISYGVGLGYSEYLTDLTAKSMRVVIPGTDIADVSPMDDVEWRIDFNDFKEEFKASFLYVPVFLEFGDINPEKIGFFMRFGVNINIPLENSFTGKGSFTSKGYYKSYDLELGNIPKLGFHTNETLFSDQPDEYSLNSLFFSGVINAGVSYPIGNKLAITLGGQYVFGLTDIIDLATKNVPGDQPRSPVHDFKMVLGNGEPTRAKWYGFQVGLIYSIREVF